MKIEEGKFYRTRDGRKAGPIYALNTGYFSGDVPQDYFYRVWRTGGQHVGGIADVDLVSEWLEPGPVRTVTRKEIVAGMHGIVKAVGGDFDHAGMGFIGIAGDWYDADTIRSAGATLIAIADALEDGK